MAAAIYLASSKPSSSPPCLPLPRRPSSPPPSSTLLLSGRGDRRGTVAVLLAGGVAALAAAASAQALPVGSPAIDALSSLQEPENALSLPTWAIHVSSVIEWVSAMALVWEYGEKSGLQTWKGLCWGMVPLLGGAFCACTWHFFYNSESLEVLVALQSALTVLGNITMCFAAYRIYKASQEGSTSS
ncbi:ycf49-like protein [Zingiber officinale]|uniref:Ycf49-like protein n=1 Tax=Zingiber officinale TaxID=94328 RepID=A0A8J5FHI5_ZINOF|nr:ycf49-like protein [Zingiber officinale]XP_042421295.1 ycf49-like protein [Zingiber officinale]XP_042421296.1 ycf49-like protein [Zingiber officinale]KAG6486880.1 hypothetical protein ZIOFF_055461 [Zingiber officinale]